MNTPIATMISHHPTTDLLVEYANGTLPWAMSIGVAAHVQLCSHCRDQVQTLNQLGGAQLATVSSEGVSEGCFDQLLSRIENTDDTPVKQQKPTHRKLDPLLKGLELPKAVKALLPKNLSWNNVSSALKTARLTAGQDDYEVAFHRICKGGKVVEHDHKGTEVTLVLEGSFSDEAGIYHRGDFLVKQPGDIHRPTATQNEDCLCLSIVEAPVKVTGVAGWFINPFLKIRPA